MTRDSGSFPRELVAEQAWLRRLARHLVQDAAVADDLVQDANLAALDERTRRGPLKPWLAQVLRNLWRMRARGAVRRRGREQSAVDPGAAAPSADLLLDRLELMHLLSRALSELAEPYRSTILMRYHDGLSGVEIARRQGIPAATVRWRLK